MAITRRRFLQFPLAAGLLPGLARDTAISAPSTDLALDEDSELYERIFTAYVDALIPRDESPGAIDLGVQRKMQLKSHMVSGQAEKLERGCDRLNALSLSQYQQSFDQLSLSRRDSIIRQIAEPDSPTHGFFLLTQKDAFAFYYSHPLSWQALSYPGPPQPIGFMDHDQPPAKDR